MKEWLKQVLGFAAADSAMFILLSKVFAFLSSNEGATARKYLYRVAPFGIGTGDELGFIANLSNAFPEKPEKAYQLCRYLMEKPEKDRTNFIIFVAELKGQEISLVNSEGKTQKITVNDGVRFLQLLDAQDTDYDKDVICTAAGIFDRPSVIDHASALADITKKKLASSGVGDWLEKNFPEEKPMKKIRRFLPW